MAPDQDLDRLGVMIRTARRTKGLSQDKLAELIPTAQSYVSAIERGSAVDLPASLIARLSELLDLDAGELVQAAADRVRARADAA